MKIERNERSDDLRVNVPMARAIQSTRQSLEFQRSLGPLNYGIEKRGAVSYIVDEKGDEVSDGYHDFEIFKSADGKVAGLIGILGAMKYVLKIPEKAGFFERTKGFHSIDYREDLGGIFTVETGAMTSILDSQSGKVVSKGYHKIFLKDGELFGQYGSRVEKILYNKQKALPAQESW